MMETKEQKKEKDQSSSTQLTNKVGQAFILILQSTHGSCSTGWIYKIHKTEDKRITTTLHLGKQNVNKRRLKIHASEIKTQVIQR